MFEVLHAEKGEEGEAVRSEGAWPDCLTVGRVAVCTGLKTGAAVLQSDGCKM